MKSKGIFISDIRPNSTVRGIFCVASKNLLETKAGKPYLAMTLMDRTGEIQARVWDNALEADRTISEGDYIEVHAEPQSWQNEVQLKVNSATLAATGVDPEDFLPVSPVDLDEYEKRLDRFVRSIKRAPLSPFIKALFRKGGGIRARFLKAPAAKKMHQAYIGGLLEHTVHVAALAEQVAKLYACIDSEILTAGALVHDIGKIDEFVYDAPPIEYSDRGRLLGHSAIGVEIIDRCAWESGIDSGHEDIMALKHFIISHHGEHEFGAAVLPMTPEALVLHLIDDIDAKMSFLTGIAAKMDRDKPSWSPYQRLFQRFFYLRNMAPREPEKDPMDQPENMVKQPGIFNGEI